MASIHQLAIYVDGSASDDDAGACGGLAGDLAQQSWTHEPAFVDQFDEVRVSLPGELPVFRTVGFLMRLPAPGSESVESSVRRDIERLIAAVSTLAGSEGIEFVIEYDQDQVGFLDGTASDSAFLSAFFGR